MARNRFGGFGPESGDQVERFMRYVAKSDGCWLWTGALFRTGYGKFGKRFGPGDYRNRDAHRVMWEITFGEIKNSKLFVCHRCDNRRCVRPSHMFLGTVLDNARDAIAKGRYRRGASWPHDKHDNRGERNGRAKLNINQVLEIRRRAAAGELQKRLALEFMVSRSAIHMVVARSNWRTA